MELEETRLESEYLYRGRILNLRKDTVRLPDEKTALREIIEHPGGVGIVAMDDRKRIYLVAQYRCPYEEITLEIPAGKRDGKDEDPLVCGKRELKEEIGATAKKWTSLGRLYPSPGYVDEVIHLYLATELNFGETDFDEDEFLTTKAVDFDEAVHMVMQNELPDSKTQVAILKVWNMMKEGSL